MRNTEDYTEDYINFQIEIQLEEELLVMENHEDLFYYRNRNK